MSELSHYITVSSSPSGCDSYNAKQFKCDRYLDCESCLEDKIKEHDKQIRAKAINDYYNKLNEKINTDTRLKETIKDIHDNVAREMYCKGIDDFVHKVKEHHYLLSDVINSTDYGMFTVGIEQIAEELKAGGENVNV